MIFKEKLQKDIGHCESQNACCVNKCKIKDFQILNGAFPITIKDLLDGIFLICAAITNLALPLVPL